MDGGTKGSILRGAFSMPRKKVQISVSLPADLVALIDRRAAGEGGRSRSDVIEGWLRRIASDPPEPGPEHDLGERIRFQTEALRKPATPHVPPQKRRRRRRPRT